MRPVAALLPREGEFAGRVALLQSSHYVVFHDELVDVVRELRRPELQTLMGISLMGGPKRRHRADRVLGI